MATNKTKGWLGRDASGILHLFTGKDEPKRWKEVKKWSDSPHVEGHALYLDWNLFKEVTWEGGLVEVEISIKNKDDQNPA